MPFGQFHLLDPRLLSSTRSSCSDGLLPFHEWELRGIGHLLRSWLPEGYQLWVVPHLCLKQPYKFLVLKVIHFAPGINRRLGFDIADNRHISENLGLPWRSTVEGFVDLGVAKQVVFRNSLSVVIDDYP